MMMMQKQMTLLAYIINHTSHATILVISSKLASYKTCRERMKEDGIGKEPKHKRIDMTV